VLVPTPKGVFDPVDIEGERHAIVLRERGGDRRLARPRSAVDQNQSSHETTVAPRSESAGAIVSEESLRALTRATTDAQIDGGVRVADLRVVAGRLQGKGPHFLR